MRINKRLTQLLSVLLILVSFTSVASSTEQVTTAEQITIAELIAQGKLKIAVSLAQAKTLLPNQEVIVNVELFSENPFNDNFTLPYFDIDNAVVVPPSAETTLDIKMIEGKQWFVQREQISIYPLQEGSYNIPALVANVFINAEQQQVIEGEITSEAFSFDVEKPVALNGINKFIASPNVSFTLKQAQENNAESDTSKKQTSYSIGSAITLTYTLKADNMHVIMLDKLAMPKINGVKVYEKPAIEKDVFDRFEKFNTAELTQEFTLIFQQEGQFTIPAQFITWWDVTENKLKEITIKAQSYTVGTGIGSVGNSGDSQSSNLIHSIKSIWGDLLAGKLADKKSVLMGLAVLVVIVFIIAVIRKIRLHRNVLLDSFHKVNKTRQKQLASDFTKQVSNHNYQQAMNCLYQLTKQVSGSTSSLSALIAPEDTDNQTRLHNLQALAFTSEQAPSVTFNEQDGELLLASLLKKKLSGRKRQSFKFSSTLNPNL